MIYIDQRQKEISECYHLIWVTNFFCIETTMCSPHLPLSPSSEIYGRIKPAFGMNLPGSCQYYLAKNVFQIM